MPFRPDVTAANAWSTSVLNTDARSAARFVSLIVSAPSCSALRPALPSVAPMFAASWLNSALDKPTVSAAIRPKPRMMLEAVPNTLPTALTLSTKSEFALIAVLTNPTMARPAANANPVLIRSACFFSFVETLLPNPPTAVSAFFSAFVNPLVSPVTAT